VDVGPVDQAAEDAGTTPVSDVFADGSFELRDFLYDDGVAG
jgi:hypothetical protein